MSSTTGGLSFSGALAAGTSAGGSAGIELAAGAGGAFVETVPVFDDRLSCSGSKSSGSILRTWLAAGALAAAVVSGEGPAGYY
jgi:hypothetical protein